MYEAQYKCNHNTIKKPCLLLDPLQCMVVITTSNIVLAVLQFYNKDIGKPAKYKIIGNDSVVQGDATAD